MRVRCGSRSYAQVNDGKSGYLSQSCLPLYFGLGDAGMVDEIEVKTQMITNLLADVRVNLETLGEHKSQVDHLSEKLARLDFMTQEAQNTLKTLQRERELAERIEQGIKQLRARAMPGGASETKIAAS